MHYKVFRYIWTTLFCFVFITNSYTNTKGSFDIWAENIPIDSLLTLIEKESGYHFSFFSDMLPEKTININKKNISINALLDHVFWETTVGYAIYSDHVILFKKEEVVEEIRIRGQILRQSDQNIIPYATIELKDQYKGTISDRNGIFEMIVKREHFNDSILISSMGYESRLYPVNHFIRESNFKIYLEEKYYEIEDVDIYPDIIERIETGNINGIPRGSIYLDTHGQQTAIFIENNKDKSGVLASVRYYISKKGNTEAPLRIHVYSIDSLNGTPGDEILPQMVVVKPKIGKGWMTINLLEFGLELPKEGMFVGIEGVFPDDIDEYFNEANFSNGYDDDKSYNEHILDEISYGQRIGYNNKGKNTTWHYSITHTWFQVDKKKFNVMIGAEIIYREKNKKAKNLLSHEEKR